MKNTQEKTTAKVSRKPQFKGINHPADLHKAWRGSGNRLIIGAKLDNQRRGARGYISQAAFGNGGAND